MESADKAQSVDSREQVDAFFQEFERRTGLRQGQINDIAREIIWLHERRKRYERWGDWFARSVITMLVGAFFTGAAWATFKFIESVATRAH